MSPYQPVPPMTILHRIQDRVYWLALAAALGTALWYYTAPQLDKAVCLAFRLRWHNISLFGGTLLCIGMMILSRRDGILDHLGRLFIFLVPAVLVSIIAGAPLAKLEWVKDTYCAECPVLDEAQQALDEGRFEDAIALTEVCADFSVEAQSIKAQAQLGLAEKYMIKPDPDACAKAKILLTAAADTIDKITDAGIRKQLTDRLRADQTAWTNLCAPAPTAPPAPLPEVTLEITPKSIVAGASATINWSSKNANKCVASDAWDFEIDLEGTLDIKPENPATYYYKITCAGAGGETFDQAQLQVTAPPVLALEQLGYRELQGTIDFRFTKDGIPIEDLQPGDVLLRSGNPVQTLDVIDLKWRSENQPICIIAVVDDSASIKNGLQDIRAAISRLNKSRGAVVNLELGMVIFNESIVSTSPAKADLDPNRITAKGQYTHLWDGMQAGLDLATECLADPLDRYLFVVTDGRNERDPNNPENPNTRNTLTTVIESATVNNTSICTVGIKSPKLDSQAVKDLKDAAVGCTYRLAETPDKVGSLLDQYLTNRINSYRIITTPNFCPLELAVAAEILPVCQ